MLVTNSDTQKNDNKIAETQNENQGNFLGCLVSGAKPCGSSHEASSNRQFAGLGEGSYRQLLLAVVVGYPSWQKFRWDSTRFLHLRRVRACPWKHEGCKTTFRVNFQGRSVTLPGSRENKPFFSFFFFFARKIVRSMKPDNDMVSISTLVPWSCKSYPVGHME